MSGVLSEIPWKAGGPLLFVFRLYRLIAAHVFQSPIHLLMHPLLITILLFPPKSAYQSPATLYRAQRLPADGVVTIFLQLLQKPFLLPPYLLLTSIVLRAMLLPHRFLLMKVLQWPVPILLFRQARCHNKISSDLQILQYYFVLPI